MRLGCAMRSDSTGVESQSFFHYLTFLLFRLGSVFDDGDVFTTLFRHFSLHSLFEVLWINL